MHRGQARIKPHTWYAVGVPVPFFVMGVHLSTRLCQHISLIVPLHPHMRRGPHEFKQGPGILPQLKKGPPQVSGSISRALGDHSMIPL